MDISKGIQWKKTEYKLDLKEDLKKVTILGFGPFSSFDHLYLEPKITAVISLIFRQ
jgi:hypothetical protein